MPLFTERVSTFTETGGELRAFVCMGVDAGAHDLEQAPVSTRRKTSGLGDADRPRDFAWIGCRRDPARLFDDRMPTGYRRRGTGIGRRDCAHQIVNRQGARAPVDASIFRLAAAEVRTLCEIVVEVRSASIDEVWQHAPQGLLGRDGDLDENLVGRIVWKDGD